MEILRRKLVDNIIELSDNEQITMVGIDGPTASGKTILANDLKAKLEKEGKECQIFCVDWALKERSQRVQDLANIKKEKYFFEFEAELHMNMKIAEDFVKKIAKANQEGTTEQIIKLNGLYSREHNGELKGEKQFELKSGMVIILEGHYTLRTNIDKYIDLNILLLSKNAELLKRKIDRVKDYRNSDDTKDYFWRIDVPSFKNHLTRFGLNADTVVDNTDYKLPKIVEKKDISVWLDQDINDTNLSSRKLEKIGDISEFTFSNSIFIPSALKKEFERAIDLIYKMDLRVSDYLRINIQSLKTDLTGFAKNVIEKLNEGASEGFQFKLTHTDSFHNVYYRKLPFSLSIGIFYKDEPEALVSIIADIFQSELRLQVVWEGAYKRISIKRQLGEIANSANNNVEDITKNIFILDNGNNVPVLLPTNFTVPSFLKDEKCDFIFIRKEDEVLSSSQGLNKFIHSNGVWIQRFAFFSELQFFQNALSMIGVHSVQAGNYLISVKCSKRELYNNFKQFRKQWELPFEKKELYLKSNDEMDSLISSIRTKAKNFIDDNCKHISMFDGYLFSDFMYGSQENISEALQELKKLMLSDNRLVRKKVFQYIFRYFSNINLKTRKLWDDLPENAAKDITLQNYIKIAPSILGEVYLWMALRDETSAVLANNIYDIRDESLDCISYLRSAAIHNSPVVLQASMNAIGHEEIDEKGEKNIGYLKLNNGPVDLVDAAMKAARNLYLCEGINPPLFAIGLDHVAVDYDTPKGRCKRFLEKALETEKITHYVQDGASLFKAKNRDMDSLNNAYMKMVNFSCDLIDKVESTYLIDREICTGELNYVGSNKQAIVPNVDEMKLFMTNYQSVLKRKGHLSLLSRPMLFIGNLGTTHHGYDRDLPSVANAKKWKDGLKNQNFVSPVLHGTTNTHPDVIRKAITGCHKINIAGDLLKVIVDNLPQSISRIFYDSNEDHKRIVASVRSLFNEMKDDEKKNLGDALTQKCDDLLNIVNAPEFSKMDINYFHYNTYKVQSEHVDLILSEIQSSIDRYKNSVEMKTADRHFSASMIEVPESDIKGELVKTLWDNKINHYHIDAGDGDFITREFTGVNKAKYLKSVYPNAKLFAHLMIKNPHFPVEGNVCPIQQYAEAGCDAISIHPRSFDNPKHVIEALKLIKNLGKRPGIVIEVNDSFDKTIENYIETIGLDWLVVMGVPIGYGGQIFQFPTLQMIKNIYDYNKRKNLDILIEVDGGLTFQTLELAKNAGAQIFSGWSIVKSEDLSVLKENVEKVRQILK